MDRSRRRFIQRASALGLSLGGLACWSGCGLPPSAGVGQKAASVPRIAYLGLGAQPVEGSPSIGAFRQGLRDLGYLEGQTILTEWRYADDADQLPDVAADMVRIWAKQLELLKEAIPALSRVAVPWYPANQANASALAASSEAARSL